MNVTQQLVTGFISQTTDLDRATAQFRTYTKNQLNHRHIHDLKY